MSDIPDCVTNILLDSFPAKALQPLHSAVDLNQYANKYCPKVMASIIAEIDLLVTDSDRVALLKQAKEATYSTYYEYLDLADASGCDLAQSYLKIFSFLKEHVFGTVFLRVNPGQIIKPHVDPVRQTAIYLPLFEDFHYSPLEIYADGSTFAVTSHDNFSFYIWDTQRLHAVFNHESNLPRYNFQLLVNLPYCEVLKKIEANIGVRKNKDVYLRYNVKKYFDCVVPSWSNKKILDWGCNHSNFLHFCEEPVDYTGCDILNDQILANQRRWPEHKWIHYQKFNRQYSSTKLKEGPWPLVENYDLIIAFSVFTHTDQHELMETIANLKAHLNPGGKILFSFFSTSREDSWRDIRAYRYEYFSGKPDLWPSISHSKVSYVSVVNDDVYLETDLLSSQQGPCSYFLAFYDDNYLLELTGGTLHEFNDDFTNRVLKGQKCIEIAGGQ